MRFSSLILVPLVFLLVLSCSTPSIVATRAIQSGDAMNNANRYPEAIAYYQEYLNEAPRLGLYRNPLKEAEVHRKLAHAYSTQGKYAVARGHLLKAVAVDSVQPDNLLNVAEDFRQLGLVSAFQGNYFAAREFLGKALAVNKGMATSLRDVNKTSYADTELALAQVCLTTGEFEEGGRHARSAHDIYSKTGGEEAGTLEALLILGILERERGNFDAALDYIRQSHTLAVSRGLNTARQDQAIGETLFLRGEWEEGLRHMLAALKQAEGTRIKPQVVMAYLRVGDAYQRLGDEVHARQYYDQAFRLQEEMQEDTSALAPSLKMRLGSVNQAYEEFTRSGSQMGAALAALRLAEMMTNRKSYDSAEAMLEKARSFFAATANREGMARADYLRGRNLAAAGRGREAFTRFRSAMRTSTQSDMTWRCWYEIGQLHEGESRYDSARWSYRKSISIIESVRGELSMEEFKSLFSSGNVSVYDRAIRLLLRRRNQWSFSADSAAREALDLSERARSRTFLDMLGNRKIHPKSAADQGLVEEEQQVRLRIRQLGKELAQVYREPGYLARVSAELQQLEERHIALLQELKLSNPEYSNMMPVPPASARALQRKLDDQTLVLEYWVSSEFLVLWALERDKLQTFVVPVTEVQLRSQVAVTRRYIAALVEEEGLSNLKFLYELLLKPVAQELSVPRNVVVIPHKVLHFLPFQALADRRGRYLAETQSGISVAPSLSVLLHCMERPVRPGERMLGLALGNSTLEGYPGLPGTRVELESLSQVYPGLTSCSEEKFTETYFKNTASTFNFIHIATHGTFNNRQPLYSFMLMVPDDREDGHLTVHEILEMSIDSKLVTLSACETGLGQLSDGDELVGLSRAFMYSGAPAVVVSLWKVDDATTSALMTRFYQYVSAGTPAAAALDLAQRDLLNRSFSTASAGRGKTVAINKDILEVLQKRDRANSRLPFYWAAFQVIGNGAIR